jgi:hypothetical protein
VKSRSNLDHILFSPDEHTLKVIESNQKIIDATKATRAFRSNNNLAPIIKPRFPSSQIVGGRMDQDILPDPMITRSIPTKQIVVLFKDSRKDRMKTQQSEAINLFLNIVPE